MLENFKKEKELLKMRTTSKGAATNYDNESDELIIDRIKEKYPGHNILTEESGFQEGKSDYLWIVDSLDGTGNFANYNPLFSVCIALLQNNELKLGAIYAPAINEFYFAERNKGAFLNGEKISVSNVSKLSKSYIIFCEGAEKNRKRNLKIIEKLYSKATDHRKIGSAGIETGWVASGRVDGYWTTKIEPWDVAAGVLLIQEAGGKVTDFKGNPWQPEQKDLICSNNKIHSSIRDEISEL